MSEKERPFSEKLKERWQNYKDAFHGGRAIGRTLVHSVTHLPSSTWYTTWPIDAAKKQFRLIYIRQAGSADEPLVCDFRVVKLSQRPHYVALSYCWGEPVFDGAIMLSGRPFAVTKALELALRRLRDHFDAVWVDQICINQGDQDEQSSQVLMMRDIYSHAHRVAIYLGEESENTQLILQWLNSLRFSVLGRRSDASFAPDDSSFRVQLVEPPAGDSTLPRNYLSMPDDVLQSAIDMLSRPYFSRRWIIQEVALCHRRLCFCGDVWFLYNIFDIYTRNFMQKQAQLPGFDTKFAPMTPGRAGKPTSLFQLISDIDELVVRAWKSYQTDGSHQFYALIDLLEMSNNFGVTNRRDVFYALFGLAGDSADVPVPNYSHSIERVFEEYTTYFLENFDPLRVLWHADLGSQQPSWVPRWEESLKPYHIQKENVKLDLDRCAIQRPSSASIMVRAASIDVVVSAGFEIAQLGDDFNKDGPLQASKQKLWLDSLLASLRELDAFKAADNKKLWAALGKLVIDCEPKVAGHFVGLEAQQLELFLSALGENPESAKDWIRLYKKDADQSAVLRQIFASAIQQEYPRRKVIVTKEGRYGWGPSRAAKGDLIVIFQGAAYISIVRQEPGGYLLVGHVRFSDQQDPGIISCKKNVFEDFTLV